jgi:hypothetical protein
MQTHSASALASAHIGEAITSAFKFMEQQGIHTYDPFDYADAPFYRRLRADPSCVASALRKTIALAARLTPRLTRRLLRTTPKATPGGVAALALAYLHFSRPDALKRANTCLQWLMNHATRGSSWIGWGFPYDWFRNGQIIQAYTPIGHTTVTVARSILEYYKHTGEPWALQALNSIGNFFEHGLNTSFSGKEALALSYTPLDHDQVLNTNADIGALMIQLGSLLERDRWFLFGMRLFRFVLQNQNRDGSWFYYAARADGKPNQIDHHHTAMILSATAGGVRSLAETDQLTPRLERALLQGTRFYLDSLFTSAGLPKFYHDRLYPLDIYNFAQAIVTLLDLRSLPALSPFLPDLEERLSRVLRHLWHSMRTTDGGFLYRRYPFVPTRLDSLRWANAYTTYALARYLSEVHASEPEAVLCQTL